MWLVAISAFSLAAIAWFGEMALLAAVALFVLAGFLGLPAYVFLGVIPYWLIWRRARCPACGSLSLRCVRVSLFWPPLGSLHRCRGCGSERVRRAFRGWIELNG